MGIFSQTSGSTCEFWVNPVKFTVQVDGQPSDGNDYWTMEEPLPQVRRTRRWHPHGTTMPSLPRDDHIIAAMRTDNHAIDAMMCIVSM
jgi:hypothetical protein